MARLTRRKLIAAGGAGGARLPVLALAPVGPPQAHARRARRRRPHAGHARLRPRRLPRRRHRRPRGQRLRPARDRCATSTGARRARTASGRVLREWELVALDREIEVAPGVTFAAWTYNGRIPGPTLRCREGERLRITFVNGSEHPHTIHFHGIHPAEMDGVPGHRRGRDRARAARPSTSSTRCRSGCTSTTATCARWPSTSPRACTARSSSTRRTARADADEMVMVMNGFDTNFDRANEVYAVNTIGFAYMDSRSQVHARRAGADLPRQRARVRPDQLVPPARELLRLLPDGHVEEAERAHRHGDALPGPARDPRAGASRTPGKFMFHAHQSEFTELGWQGFFEVVVMTATARRAGAPASPPGCSGSSRCC